MMFLEAILDQYWQLLLTVALFAALVLILIYLDHHDGGST